MPRFVSKHLAGESTVGEAATWAATDVGPDRIDPPRAADSGLADTVSSPDIAQHGRGLRTLALKERAEAARRAFGLYEALKALRDAQLPSELDRFTRNRSYRHARSMPPKRDLPGAAYNKRRALDEMGAEAVGELEVVARAGPLGFGTRSTSVQSSAT